MLYNQFSLAICFIYNSLYMSIIWEIGAPNLPVSPTPLSPLGNGKFVLCICDSVSALPMSYSL